MMAAVALADPPGEDLAVTRVATLRANKTVRPAPVEQRVAALFVSALLCQKIHQTETLLELNLILGHLHLLVLLQVHYPTPRGSLAEH